MQTELNHENLIKKDLKEEEVLELIDQNNSNKDNLIPILHAIQDRYNYLPKNALEIVSKYLEIPMANIYGVATFYTRFSLKPKGKYTISVCMGTACYVKGAQNIVDKLCKELNVHVGETTSDMIFTLETARCIGSCGLAPALMIDDKVYAKVHPNDVIRILSEYR
ncbi:NADH-quinone oxidoreductase subunit NuoE [Peptostreptococcaceae bacterium AGR-M142]